MENQLFIPVSSVGFPSFLAMHLSVFLVLLMCVWVFLCHSVHRQTNRHSKEISETVPAHARTFRDHLRTLELRWWRVWRWFTLALQNIYQHRDTSMHDCLFAFLIIPDRWWPDSDLLSLLIQSYTPTCILVCVCMCIFFFFICFVQYTLQLVA